MHFKKKSNRQKSLERKKEVLEGSLELCRLEALWHRAKAPHLTPRQRGGGSEGWNDGEISSCKSGAETMEIQMDGEEKKEHLTNAEEKASLPLQVMPC